MFTNIRATMKMIHPVMMMTDKYCCLYYDYDDECTVAINKLVAGMKQNLI